MFHDEEIPLRLLRLLRNRSERPLILLTSSHRPSRRTRSFIKDLEATIYGAVRLTRGHLSMDELGVIARRLNVERLVILMERKGNPGIIVSFRPEERGLVEVTRLPIVGVTLRRELRSRVQVNGCRGVYGVSESTFNVVDAVAKAFALQVLNEPVGNYLEVREEEGVYLIVPRSEKGFSGPIIRVRL
ncbi:MAG: putative exosome subunit/U3 small nucleolar ribonucleoprotein (snoRNP) component, contains IMP4 domain [uncultured Acidilobus sp. CIS]|nr:MAG: putative exosome subunit/U3 small nucleolar ribonucleoprotein (snoRNP) component, contains IMP4 domain [uncultured Acidilobus sp. CIS]